MECMRLHSMQTRPPDAMAAECRREMAEVQRKMSPRCQIWANDQTRDASREQDGRQAPAADFWRFDGERLDPVAELRGACPHMRHETDEVVIRLPLCFALVARNQPQDRVFLVHPLHP